MGDRPLPTGTDDRPDLTTKRRSCWYASVGVARPRRAREGLLPRLAVDGLPQQVGVADVAGVLLDQVEQHPA